MVRFNPKFLFRYVLRVFLSGFGSTRREELEGEFQLRW